MAFYVPPHEAGSRLRSLIEAGGGTIVEQPGASEVIHILPEGCSSKKLKGREAVSARWVEECISKRRLLPKGNFIIGPAPVPPPAPAAAPAPVAAAPQIVQAERPQGSYAGRLHFTAADDAAMRDWVLKNPGLKRQGRQMWERAERAKVTRHPWQSMQNHWRRCLAERGAAPRRVATPAAALAVRAAGRAVQPGQASASVPSVRSAPPRADDVESIEDDEEGEGAKVKPTAKRARVLPRAKQSSSKLQSPRVPASASAASAAVLHQDAGASSARAAQSSSSSSSSGARPQSLFPEVPDWLMAHQDLTVQIDRNDI